MLEFSFPRPLSARDPIYKVEVKYRLGNAACKNGDKERGEFHAKWANIWRVPVSNIVYSFTLPLGNWQGSPWVIEPSGPFASSPTPTVPKGKGPRVEYKFLPSELSIGSHPKTIIFAWDSCTWDSCTGDRELRSCEQDSRAGLLVLLVLLALLLPLGCCVYNAYKRKPPAVIAGGASYTTDCRPPISTGGIYRPTVVPRPQFASLADPSPGYASSPSVAPLPGQHLPTADPVLDASAAEVPWAVAVFEIPTASPGDDPCQRGPPYVGMQRATPLP